MVSKQEIAFNEHLGKVLKKARLMAGITQTMLGEQVGVTFQQIQKYENGSDRIATYYLMRAANFLNTPIERFFDQSVTGFNSSLKMRTEPVARLIDIYSELKSKYRALLLQIAEAFQSAE